MAKARSLVEILPQLKQRIDYDFAEIENMTRDIATTLNRMVNIVDLFKAIETAKDDPNYKNYPGEGKLW